MNYDNVGVIIGRFQTPYLHPAHIELIQEVYKENSELIILVGVTDAIGTTTNPLPFEVVKSMFKRLTTRPLMVLPIYDHPSDEFWSESVDKLISSVCYKKKVTLYGGRKSFIDSYSGKFECKLVTSIDNPISSTQIRKTCERNVLESDEFRKGIIYAAYQNYPTVYSTIDAAILNDDNQVLLCKKAGEEYWRFVGGFVDVKDKSEVDSVKREVSEETGLEINVTDFICSGQIDDWRYRYTPDRKIMTHFYLCKRIFGVAQPKDDIIACKWFNFSSSTYNGIMPQHRWLYDNLIKHLNEK